MDDETLREQRRLVELISKEGWNVTNVELSVFDYQLPDRQGPEVTMTITAKKPCDDDNPYRVK
ncbi:hypothetical protein [Natronobiforma cellulositropha]|uniref:hypothetical protein n=1 Tax=Natronobiforma cellulositropha TaxID=1679076 RepID=UPI0021D5B928|nr:hypothetical protein [Natronobiforma cellulositropha]